jgi:hypothetical protein
MNNNYQCEIKANNNVANDPCAFCGGRTNPKIPLAIFKRGTNEPICDECAMKYAPDEFKALAYDVKHCKNGRIVSKPGIDMTGMEEVLDKDMSPEDSWPLEDDFFIPIDGGYRIYDDKSGIYHCVIGMQAYNLSDLFDDERLGIRPVVIWGGNMENCNIRRELPF